MAGKDTKVLISPQSEDSRKLYEKGFCLVKIDVESFHFEKGLKSGDPRILAPVEKRADYDPGEVFRGVLWRHPEAKAAK